LLFIAGGNARLWLVLLIAAGFLGLSPLFGPGVGRTAKAEFRPAFRAVIEVAIDKGLRLTLCFVTYFDYIL